MDAFRKKILVRISRKKHLGKLKGARKKACKNSWKIFCTKKRKIFRENLKTISDGTVLENFETNLGEFAERITRRLPQDANYYRNFWRKSKLLQNFSIYARIQVFSRNSSKNFFRGYFRECFIFVFTGSLLVLPEIFFKSSNDCLRIFFCIFYLKIYPVILFTFSEKKIPGGKSWTVTRGNWKIKQILVMQHFLEKFMKILMIKLL